MVEVAGGSRLSVIALEQLEPMVILEKIDTETILRDRMRSLVAYWRAMDPPAGAVYDVDMLEFDPLKINQEVGTYFELMVRDRVNQAARAVTGAFAISTDLDAIASRYPGGVPRLPLVDNPRPFITNPEDWEADDRYRRRIWLSANALSPHGIYESYVFWALTADVTLKDATATTVPGSGVVNITIMAGDTANPTVRVDRNTGLVTAGNPLPTQAQLNRVYSYILDKARKGLTDVIQVAPPKITTTDINVRYWLFPGFEETALRTELIGSIEALLTKQYWLGYDNNRLAIDGVLARNGVFNAIIDQPVKDVPAGANGLVRVRSVTLRFIGRGE